MSITRGIVEALRRPYRELRERRYREIARDYDFAGHRRIYLVHIRKTGGTSLNNMFLSLGHGDAGALYDELARTAGHRLVRDGKVFVGWNVELINRGNYFYAFSHAPLHRLDLPPRTFTVTCLRDPVARVLSHYNMLLGYRRDGVDHPCMVTEGPWLGDGFADFLQRIPPEHLLNQLYTFSASFDVDEAVAGVRGLSHWFLTEQFESGIEALNAKTGLQLRPVHLRRSPRPVEVDPAELQRLRELLAPEYELIHRLRDDAGD